MIIIILDWGDVAGQSHLREAVLVHEESMRLQRMCRELKKRDHLSSFLRAAHEAALTAYTLAQGEDDFGEALDPPPILGIATHSHHEFIFRLMLLKLNE